MGIARLLRLKEVIHVTGMSKATIYRKIAAEEFPRPKRAGTQTVVWREEDLQTWRESLQATTNRLTHA